MNTSDKNEFFSVISKTAGLYDKKINPDRVRIYWDALIHRDIADIKKAINKHIQDADRGRFFPLPADITAQLPREANPWLDANEAWAACPKSESESVAMCDEMAQALFIAQDLIDMGDTIAARMAFIEHYKRLVEVAKSENRKPAWFPSYGEDKTQRFKADREVIERQNLALPNDEKKALPEPESVKQIEFKDLMKLGQDHAPKQSKDVYKKSMTELRNIIKG